MNMNFGTNKKLFLAAPSDFEINKRIKQNLKKFGFEVILHTYVYRWSIPTKDIIIHNYKKIIHKDRTYKTEIRKVRNEEWQKKYEQSIASDYKHFDYALFIRPDQYSIEFVESIVAISDVSAAYQWDGMDRFPEVKEYTNLFNRFFVFDEHDLETYPSFHFITNFYFEKNTSEDNIQDIFFIGSYLPERKELLNQVTKRFKDAGLRTNINIFSLDKKLRKEKNIFNIVDRFFTFEENQENVKKSKFVLDISNSVHHGLSFRTFESLGYRKKLITNNTLVKQYDFYNPNNIFVFEDYEMNGFEEFIKTPYENIPEDIYNKYSFENWIKYIFKIHPFTEITKP